MKHFFLLLALLANRPATLSLSDWTITDRTVTARLSLPAAGADLVVGSGLEALSNPALARYVLTHLQVTAGTLPCPPLDQGEDVGTVATLADADGLRRFEIVFQCPSGSLLRLTNHALFAEDPRHLDLARIRRPDIEAETRLFDADHQTLTPTNENSLLLQAARLGLAALGLPALLLAAIIGTCLPTRRAALTCLAAYAAGAILAAAALALHLAAARQLLPPAAGLMLLLLALYPRPAIAAAAAALLATLAAAPLLTLAALGTWTGPTTLPAVLSLQTGFMAAAASIAAVAAWGRHLLAHTPTAPLSRTIAAALGAFWLVANL